MPTPPEQPRSLKPGTWRAYARSCSAPSFLRGRRFLRVGVGAASLGAMSMTCDRSVDVSASADRVWNLVSTSEGLSGWFTDATVAPGPQGSVTLRFAPGAEAAVPILVWEPSRRIRFGMPDGGRVHDITIMAIAAGCRVRVRDEGVPDAEAESTAAGWQGFLHRLRALADETG
jgi:uncharacterized protein YndB with AHSA1/START domain